MVDYRAGIISISDPLRPYIHAALPPEHRIVGERPDRRPGVSQLLVEGPWMPTVAEGGEPGVVQLFFQMNVEGDVKTVIGKLAHDASRTWTFAPPVGPL